MSTANNAGQNILKVWKALSLWQKLALGTFLIIINVLFILFLVYNEDIMVWLQPRAVAWSNRPAGWLLIWFFAFITAFPPLIGYSTSITLCGFIYGIWPGWPIAASANIAGSTAAFLVCRYYLHDWTERKIAHDKRFRALALVLKQDGLKILTLIRLCPLPYSLSNGAFSTFPTVSAPMFAAATAIASPKLLLHVFVGSRFAAVGKDRNDTSAKVADYISIAASSIFGAVTGWVIWRRTQARSRQLEAEEQAKLIEDGRREETSDDDGDGRGLTHPDDFADDDAQDLDETGQASHNDDIDFLGSPAAETPYSDDRTDETDSWPHHSSHS